MRTFEYSFVSKAKIEENGTSSDVLANFNNVLSFSLFHREMNGKSKAFTMSNVSCESSDVLSYFDEVVLKCYKTLRYFKNTVHTFIKICFDNESFFMHN
jgi:hypothetical protein